MKSAQRPGSLIRVENERGQRIELPSGRTYPPGSRIRVETPHFRASVATEGYVSGVAAGSFLDKKTGARDLGYGLDIVDFLLEPATAAEPIAPGQYHYGDNIHGRIAKRYVEGPQICTQARKLPAMVSEGEHFAAVRLKYQWNQAYPPHHAHAGSVWEQTLIFPADERFFLSADRVTTVSQSPALFLRIDMPGHIKHRGAMGFDHVYLSYNDPPQIPSTEFATDFGPDERFLYQRGAKALPERFIRAYQVDLGDGKPGPWLAGMTLNPADVYQAWCHERGYVCLIEEIGGRPTKPGTTFGACYLIGWFDTIAAMNQTYDRYRGASGLALDGLADRPTGFHTVKQDELPPVVL